MRRTAHKLEFEEPIRAELFGNERLEQHAQSLATAQTITSRPQRVPSLLARVRDNRRVLLAAYRVIAKAVRDESAITPGAEWFVDNFHIVEDQVREIQEDLPPGYYRELSKLADGPLAGYPRVFGITWAYVAHTESRFDPDTFLAFVRAYQSVQVLTLGELWALAISLRVILLENLRRLVDQIVRRRAAREAADRLADECLGLVAAGPAGLEERLRGPRPLETAFCVQLIMRLRGQDPTSTPVLRWLDERLAEQGTTADERVQLEHQRQGTTNLIVRNVITSMRLISSFDWADFLEDVSLVEHTLRRHAAYAAMDFATRDRYRRAVEQLARRSGLTEIEVAERSVRMAIGARIEASAATDLRRERRTDPGYWLIAEGQRDFERELGVLAPRSRVDRRRATLLYLLALASITLALVLAPLLAAHGAGASAVALFTLLALALLPASDLAVALVQRLVTAWWPPAFLPRLDLSDGVPQTLRTIVVVPTLLSDIEQVKRQVHALEIHYLASAPGALHFALLSDWRDAPSETMPGDEESVAAAQDSIARLNERYGKVPGGGARFLLLHRRRLYNKSEGKWLGWERKRGKLHELNRLLRGARDTTFTTADSTQLPTGVRYVVTLDADTRLPRGAVARLVGAIAHPLNRPCFDAALGRVVAGYGVLQPKITPALPSELEGSVYRRVFSGQAGMDPYAFAVSDVYQDLFDEGSYVGKGIYDVDAFEAALAHRVPDNALLSHDLFEGLFLRAGLDTQTELFEDAPAHVLVAAAQQHRWTRGDWQLLPWIWRPGRRTQGLPDTPPVPAIERWKMIDNLRRSLAAPAIVLLFVAAWLVPNAAPTSWMRLLLAALVLPAMLPLLNGILPRRRRVSLRAHFGALFEDVVTACAQVGISLALLANQAWQMSDAIVRTLVRVYITRRRLLQWVTAAQTTARARAHVASFYRSMSGSLILVAGSALLLLSVGTRQALLVTLPVLALWASAPLIACLVSRLPRRARIETLTPDQARQLRQIARRTWQFFAKFVDDENHALPPDNFQETPNPVVAHRTSPTNMGLYLLSVTAARDFGWIGTREAVDRLEKTLATMQGLERFRGHFLNWYDTRTLQPLEPRYVSSVDSGNLAGHLLALEQGARELLTGPVAFARVAAGIEDAADLARQTLSLLADDRGTSTVTRTQMADAGERLGAQLRLAVTLDDRIAQLAALRHEASDLADIARTIHRARGDSEGTDLSATADAVVACIESHQRDLEDVSADDVKQRIAAIVHDCAELRSAMDFRFLYDDERKLFAIGAVAPEGKLDPGFFDLLASEARLTSFLAIAQGDVEVEHWFHMGRSLTPTKHGAALISWSGSMFEYLMPALVMRSPTNSLLERTYHAIVRRQIAYGRKRGVPWGVSESAYHKRDLQQTYQYLNFGVPGLGLKRGLFNDVVIAPYATALAAMVDPVAALRNFAHLDREGGRGVYGYYDALDYNAERLPDGQRVGVVRTYMAHHQGMTILAITNVLLDGRFRAHFHAHPIVEATELLLQERTPRDVDLVQPRAEEVEASHHVQDLVPPMVRRLSAPHAIPPHTHLLSNGRYTVMVTAAGSGYSRWQDLAVTRWREDATQDAYGSHVFLHDATTRQVWSAGWQPSGTEPDAYEVGFSEDRVEIMRKDGVIATTLEIVLSPENDVEVRRVSLRNLDSRPHEIEVTSYAEIVLAPHAADVAHPAFSNLFVETEAAPSWNALIATRRPRALSETQVWAGHVIAVQGEVVGELQYETDRVRFLGRGRGLRDAVAVRDGRPLSGTTGRVLDPIFSLRRRVRIEPGATARVLFSTFIAGSRETAFDLADKARDVGVFERTCTMAWTHGQVQMHHLGIEQDEAHLFQQLANRVVFLDPTLRGSAEVLKRNAHGARSLWGLSISGDLPIVLVRIDDPEDLGIVRQTLRAWQYWRLKRLAVDLVILNERATSYIQDLQASLETQVRQMQAAPRQPHDLLGNTFVLRGDLVNEQQREVLTTLARVVLSSRRGTLAEQILRPRRVDRSPPWHAGSPQRAELERVKAAPRRLEFFNGLGGFARQGREYAITLGAGQWTPAPWINVIANESFGFQVSECGSGYTWAINSRENKLTAWSNDPVSDPCGEAIYLCDLDTSEVWTPTALPIRLPGATYEVAHGQGYSRFEVEAHDIASTLTQFVLADAPVKVSRLTLVNRSPRARSLSVTAYVEWLLGVTRDQSAPFVVTEIDSATGTLLARNACNGEFAGQVAFLAMSPRATEWTGDRGEFLGRNSTLDRPAALLRQDPLSQRVGAGLDPCAALQRTVHLAPGARIEIAVFLGEGASPAAARQWSELARGQDLDAALRAVSERWQELIGDVQVTTPDRALDIMLDHWLPYQTLVCRLWSRSAFYQSGGAYGFRDQLQDVMAFTATRPELAREQILRCAARQFVEGDVQHWWHPPTGRGVRTRCSDDLIWLPYVVNHWIDVTGDATILDQQVGFIEGPPLAEDQHETYFEPSDSAQRASLFEHCARALDRSLAVGPHRLPLIGSGDWNDGMNRIGILGKGESTWLAWLLHTTLWEFAKLAAARGESRRAEAWRLHVSALKAAVEEQAWDGAWYRRAYDDAGTPLGSAESDECQIDSIAQSWGVISGAAEPARAERAMAAVDARLVQRQDRLVRLFTPPFVNTSMDVGYIKGYLAGVRENGGQYTHAAVWTLIAFAVQGDGDKAMELFSLLNPIRHADTRAGVNRYRVEPYVLAGDVYGEPPHLGRGGWTWYTGAAGWLYRAGVEWLLGLRVRRGRLTIDPCIPRAWPAYEMRFRHGATLFEITVQNPRGVMRGVASVSLDGRALAAPTFGIALSGERKTHRVVVTLGP